MTQLAPGFSDERRYSGVATGRFEIKEEPSLNVSPIRLASRNSKFFARFRLGTGIE